MTLVRGVLLLLCFATASAAQGVSVVQLQGTVQGTVGGVPGAVMSSMQGAPTAIISGTVIDENDAPVPNATVQGWYEITLPDGTRRQMGGGGSRPTDQGGRFTLDHLQPGEYIVAVMPPTGRPYGMADQSSYPLTYFPGVTDVAQAQRVPSADSGAKPITIRVRHAPTFHVRGTVTSPSGRSTVGLSVQLAQQVFTTTYSRVGTAVQPDGRFDIGGITSGSYVLSTNIGFGGSTGDFAVADITVQNRDLDGVVLNLISGATIRGRLVLDKPLAGAAPLGLSVQTMPGAPPLNGTMGRMATPVAVAADWTFEIRGLYGKYRFGLQAQGLPDYALVRTVLDGRDIGSMLDVSVTTGTHELLFYLAHR